MADGLTHSHPYGSADSPGTGETGERATPSQDKAPPATPRRSVPALVILLLVVEIVLVFVSVIFFLRWSIWRWHTEGSSPLDYLSPLVVVGGSMLIGGLAGLALSRLSESVQHWGLVFFHAACGSAVTATLLFVLLIGWATPEEYVFRRPWFLFVLTTIAIGALMFWQTCWTELWESLHTKGNGEPAPEEAPLAQDTTIEEKE